MSWRSVVSHNEHRHCHSRRDDHDDGICGNSGTQSAVMVHFRYYKNGVVFAGLEPSINRSQSNSNRTRTLYSHRSLPNFTQIGRHFIKWRLKNLYLNDNRGPSFFIEHGRQWLYKYLGSYELSFLTWLQYWPVLLLLLLQQRVTSYSQKYKPCFCYNFKTKKKSMKFGVLLQQ